MCVLKNAVFIGFCTALLQRDNTDMHRAKHFSCSVNNSGNCAVTFGKPGAQWQATEDPYLCSIEWDEVR